MSNVFHLFSGTGSDFSRYNKDIVSALSFVQDDSSLSLEGNITLPKCCHSTSSVQKDTISPECDVVHTVNQSELPSHLFWKRHIKINGHSAKKDRCDENGQPREYLHRCRIDTDIENCGAQQRTECFQRSDDTKCLAYHCNRTLSLFYMYMSQHKRVAEIRLPMRLSLMLEFLMAYGRHKIKKYCSR